MMAGIWLFVLTCLYVRNSGTYPSSAEIDDNLKEQPIRKFLLPNVYFSLYGWLKTLLFKKKNYWNSDCDPSTVRPSLFYLPDAMIVLLAFPKATNATPTGIRKPAPPNIFRPHVCKKPQWVYISRTIHAFFGSFWMLPPVKASEKRWNRSS